MLVFPRTQLQIQLQLLKPNYQSAVLKLFKNDYTPVDTSTLANFTEADFDGYAPITLNAWGNAFINGSNIAEIDEVVRTFTCTGNTTPNTIYGYYLEDVANQYLFAERNPAGGIAINTAGQVYVVWPRVTLRNQT